MNLTIRAVAMSLVLLWSTALAAKPAAPPAEVKMHQQRITQSPADYTVHVGGTMDGMNTRGPVGYRVFDQVFEPNIEVSITNTGDSVVRNPRLRIDGRGGWRNIQEMVSEFAAGLKTDADKARAAYEFQRSHRFHCSTYDAEVRDVVKALNCYGYTLCFDDSKCLAQLWQEMGLQTRRGWPYGHSVTEVFYDGGWHMMDGDEHCIFLLRDNRTIASEEQFVRDPDLVKRTHSYGPLQRDNRRTDEGGAGLFYYDGPRGGTWREKCSHTMDFDLRPGEKITWRWEYAGRYHGFEDIDKWARAATRICNGYLEYAPDLKSPRHQKGIIYADLPAENGIRQVVTIPVKSAWPIVGGWIEVATNAPAELQEVRILKSRSQEPQSVWTGQNGAAASQPVRIDLNSQFPPASQACYDYRIQLLVRRTDRPGQCPIQPDPLKSFRLHSTLQMAWLAMPALACGDNRVVYADDSDSRVVRIEHKWTERSDSAPPGEPQDPKFPPHACYVRGTKFKFEWQAPAGPEKIADYWFELFDRPDMRWPLSPNFEKRISCTANTGTASLDVPCEGLLSPGQTYRWRVRARNAAGVWGPWSAVSTFAVDAPAPPVNVRLNWNKDERVLTLSWDPNTGGEKPAAYVVYGSDEKGFTASDDPYPVNVGRDAPLTFLANRIAHTTRTSYRILPSADPALGEPISAPKSQSAPTSQLVTDSPVKMFYRVVAVAEDATRSGPSDYAAAPGPIIYTAAPKRIPYDRPTVFQMRALASIGNLQSRATDDKSYQGAFGLNADELRWSIHSDTHAGIDPKTGRVYVKPAIWDLGPAEFIVICRNQRGESDAYRFTIDVVPPDESGAGPQTQNTSRQAAGGTPLP